MKKLNLSTIRSTYFIGIGGIGMSALARYFNNRGIDVSGYDRNPTWLTQELISEGINIIYDDVVEFPEKHYDLIVYTPAIPPDNIQLRYYTDNEYLVMKRAEVLGQITKDKYTIAVAGTHGKTTITSMIAHIMKNASYGMTSFFGGISKNYESNYVTSSGNGIMVVEADEYDRSFLQLSPNVAVISSIDPDHLDIYSTLENLRETFRQYTGRIEKEGTLVIRADIDLPAPANIRVLRYGVDKDVDFFAFNIREQNEKEHFSINLGNEVIEGISLRMPGTFNIENAIAAAGVCYLQGIAPEKIREGLNTYLGAHRRFDFIYQNGNTVYIDDYAHHPEEIKACITTARKLFPGKIITGIFQPHLFSRTADLAGGFAESLDLFDEIILLDIYPAREEPIIGVNSELILKKMSNPKKVLLEKNKLMEHLWERDFEVLMTLGAGDIDQFVELIEDMLKRKAG